MSELAGGEKGFGRITEKKASQCNRCILFYLSSNSPSVLMHVCVFYVLCILFCCFDKLLLMVLKKQLGKSP